MEEIIEDSTLGGYFVQDRDRTEISGEHLRLLEREARDYYEENPINSKRTNYIKN